MSVVHVTRTFREDDTTKMMYIKSNMMYTKYNPK